MYICTSTLQVVSYVEARKSEGCGRTLRSAKDQGVRNTLHDNLHGLFLIDRKNGTPADE